MSKDLNFEEKDLHPYLVYFAYQQLGCYSKTINAGKSSNKQAGLNGWVHPDIVSFKLKRNDFTSSDLKAFYRHMNQDVAYLYSFELKREIKLSELKKIYFQAVSNSSWANEGYLVTAKLDITNKGLMNEIERLTQAFGIGVILLDVETIENSCILFEAQKKTELDFYAINKLIEENNGDFIDFVKAISACLKAADSDTVVDSVIKQKMDEIKKPPQIVLSKPKSEKKQKESTKEPLKSNLSEWLPLTGRDFTGTKASAIKIKEYETSIKNWRHVLIEMAKYCKQLNPQLFQKHCFEIEDESVLLFFRDTREEWKNKKEYTYVLIEENIYLCVHGNCNSMGQLTLKLGNTFGISSSEIHIKLQK